MRAICQRHKDMQREHVRQITQYFTEVKQKPLLSREREITLAEQKDAGRKARRQLVSGSFLTREQGLRLEEQTVPPRPLLWWGVRPTLPCKPLPQRGTTPRKRKGGRACATRPHLIYGDLCQSPTVG